METENGCQWKKERNLKMKNKNEKEEKSKRDYERIRKSREVVEDKQDSKTYKKAEDWSCRKE